MSLLEVFAYLLLLIQSLALGPPPEFGVTFYDRSWEGRPLHCGEETYRPDLTPWATVPIEWMELGLVQCGDVATVVWPDGRVRVAVVRDVGCHLHYGVWDTNLPFVVEFDAYSRNGLPTQTVIVQMWRGHQRLPIEAYPLEATAVKYCKGPLTIGH